MTADELLRANQPDKRTELVRGTLIVREPAGGRHGFVAVNIAAELVAYVKRTGSGAVFAAQTGFKLASDPDTVRAPDVAFIRRERLPDPLPAGFPTLAPDLVVEVLSPDDRPRDVEAKVADWLAAGTRLVWIVDPERRLARVHRENGTVALVAADDVLEGEDVLAGFTCALRSIL